VLYECLTAKVVFEAPTLPALMVKHLEEEPQDPRAVNADIPDQFAEVVLKALSKEPGDRFETASAMYQALDAVRLT
jgi:serine/threonine protein kinase